MKDPMEDPKLDAEEKDLLESVERGEWKRVENYEEEREMLRQAAENTLRKDKRINIRLSAKDMMDIKTVALQEGLPYQTLISSIIHKYVTGALIDRKALIVHEAPVSYKTRSDERG